MVKCNGIDDKQKDEVEALAKEKKKESLKYAWLLDKMRAERERGMTIDISVTRFESGSR